MNFTCCRISVLVAGSDKSASVWIIIWTVVFTLETKQYNKDASLNKVTQIWLSKLWRISQVTLMADERKLGQTVVVIPLMFRILSHTELIPTVVIWAATFPKSKRALGLVGPSPRHSVQTNPTFNINWFYRICAILFFCVLDRRQVCVVFSAVCLSISPCFWSWDEHVGFLILVCSCRGQKRNQFNS